MKLKFEVSYFLIGANVNGVLKYFGQVKVVPTTRRRKPEEYKKQTPIINERGDSYGILSGTRTMTEAEAKEFTDKLAGHLVLIRYAR